ncbi:unnamed protein product [Meganyctiphanes norvegica]|uniref:C2H2-type domain-containing protein n=2 Tax=Meganyctiphanes norvegica TaxID=48144 RepID=A0AAV2QTK5_MEGNR
MDYNEIRNFLIMVKQEMLEDNKSEEIDKRKSPVFITRSDMHCIVNENFSNSDHDPIQHVEVPLKQEVNEQEDQNGEYVEKPFVCTDCECRFSMETLLNRHIQNHRHECSLSCPSGSFQTSNKEALDQPKSLHKDAPQFTCSKCNFGCSDENDFNAHTILHSKETLYSCEICDYTSNRKDHFKSHTLRHSNDKPYACSECEYKSGQQKDLKRHMYIHTEEKPYNCHLCDYKSTNNSHLKEHMVIHTGDKPYSCSLCEFRCAWPKGLKRHMLKHTGKMPFACADCDYKTVDKGNLRSHKLVHLSHDEKPFSCKECDYKCVYKSLLSQHMLTHTGEKSFLCEYCPYKCARKRDMDTHTKIHTGEKPFACSDCDYKSSDRGNLRRHRLTHTGEKPFACTICTYTCSLRWLLRKHILTHSNESSTRKSSQSSKNKTHPVCSEVPIKPNSKYKEPALCQNSDLADSGNRLNLSPVTSSQSVSVSNNNKITSASQQNTVIGSVSDQFHLHQPHFLNQLYSQSYLKNDLNYTHRSIYPTQDISSNSSDTSLQSDQIYNHIHQNYIPDASQIPFPINSYASNHPIDYGRLVRDYIKK